MWHHPLPNLVGTIQYGQGNMPAWKDTLSIPESLAIIAWLQKINGLRIFIKRGKN